MQVVVLGMWHLGTVTAAGLASIGHSVIAFDENPETIRRLVDGTPPVAEPGLRELIRAQREAGRLSFSSDPTDLAAAEVVWVAYDTPVDENDRADVDFVLTRLRALFPHVRTDAVVLVSSQMPVGSTRRLEASFADLRPGSTAAFAYSPENLRLGKALDVFLRPDRVVVGVRDSATRECISQLLSAITDQIQWMSVESAEMTKHALNAFLATSVAFINEVAGLCERVGADAGDVARALKSDVRIGPRAYLNPGTAFAGGTLARDLSFMEEIGASVGRSTLLLTSVIASNVAHRRWPLVRMRELVSDLESQTVAVLGLTYKPGTDTLRRSTAMEICCELHRAGARVRGFDPSLIVLPEDLRQFVDLRSSLEAAISGATVLFIGTDCPEFRSLEVEEILAWMRTPLVLDPGGFLESPLGKDDRIRYVKVGRQGETSR